MKYVLIVSTRHADPDVYGPFDTEEAAEAARPAIWRMLEAEGVDTEEAAVEVAPLRQLRSGDAA